MVQLEFILAYIGAPVITALVGLILEYYLSIIPRLKKIKSILFNDSAKLDLLVWFESKEDFDKIKREFISILEKNGKLDKVSINSESKLEIKLNYFNIVLMKHDAGVYIFRTENISTGIRDIKQEAQKAIDVLGDLRDKINDITFKDISINLFLPYKSNYVPDLKIKNYRLEDYKISYISNKFKSHIELNIKNITITDLKLENLIYTLDNFISIF